MSHGQESGGARRAVSRRALFTGVGGSAALLTAGALAPSADATPRADRSEGVAPAATHPDGAPVTSSIGSLPINGRSYRSKCMYDFFPFEPAAQKTWGGFGVYSAGTQSSMRADIDLPPGALVRDIEWYVYNNSGSDVTASLYQYTPGQGAISPLDAEAQIPSSSSGITSMRVEVPEAGNGPFPLGSTLLASLTTPTSTLVQINGVRVGFTQGGQTVGLLPEPVRAFDSRKGHKLAGGSARTITFSDSIVTPGVVGLLLNVTALEADKAGSIKVFAGNASAGTASLFYGTDTVANAVTTRVSTKRQVKILASKPVHVIVDVIGTLS